MLNFFDNLSIQVDGASHSEEIVTTLKGVEIGEKIDLDELQAYCDRRRSNNPTLTTPRREADELLFTSGFDIDNSSGKRIGTVVGDIVVTVKNKVNNSRDYESLKHTPRPSHADYTALCKYGDKVDLRGGGRFSGRLTLMHCIAGGIAKQILSREGVEVRAYIGEIAGVKGKSYKDSKITISDIDGVEDKSFLTLSNREDMESEIINARLDGDSVGGVVECIAFGLPTGLGGELTGGMEGRLAGFLYSIPAVKGVEFGAGFDISKMRGSFANDAFRFENGKVVTKTNNNGGINGGISNGMDMTMRVAFKPTPSISKEQETVNLESGENVVIKIGGRHDACIVTRAVVGVESAVNLVVYDTILSKRKGI
ncbi:MAG: chorismate synthase [Clostridia bacterium]|nr:chorismate synthase [Clostridia bacterium]